MFAQIRSAGKEKRKSNGLLLLSPAGCEEVGGGDRENLSQLFQDYYSAVTSHFTHSSDRELAGRRAAKGLCGEEGEGEKKKRLVLRTLSIFDSGKSWSGR